MLDAKAVLDQLLSSGARSGAPLSRSEDTLLPHALERVAGIAGPNTGGAPAGGLVALLLGARTGRRLGEAAVRVGGLALIGGLAYKAWQDWKAGTPPEETRVSPDPAELPPPVTTAFGEAAIATRADETSLLLLRAMIAAARASHRVDAEDRAHVKEALSRSALDRHAQNFLMDALARPDDLDALAVGAATPELAAEVWLAARIAVDADDESERAFLARLADRLKLAPGLVAHLEATAVAAKDDHPTI